MFALVALLFMVASVFVFAVIPIVIAVRLRLKFKIPIILLTTVPTALTYIVAFVVRISERELETNVLLSSIPILVCVLIWILSEIAVYILIGVNMSMDGYFQKENTQRTNFLNIVRKNERKGYISNVGLYVFELIAIILPMVKISVNDNVEKITQHQIQSGMYDVFGILFSPFKMQTPCCILLGIIIVGIVINVLVRDPRKTLFFDGIIQLAYLLLSALFLEFSEFSDYVSNPKMGIYTSTSIGLFLMPFISAFFVFVLFFGVAMAIEPEPRKTLRN